MRIKDFWFIKVNLYKYTQKVVAYMVMIGERQISLNIWLESFNQDTATKNIIITIQFKETLDQK